MDLRVLPGRPNPLGVTFDGNGVNVAWPTLNADRVVFCIFDAEGHREVARLALPERQDGIVFGRIEGVQAGTRYGLRVHGPYAPEAGHRFNANKLLVDPWAKAIDRPFRLARSMFGYRRDDPAGDLSFDDADSAADMPKAVVLGPSEPRDDTRPRTPWANSFVYEAHVKGLSRLHPTVPEAMRGKVAALSQQAILDHLLKLGVTTVELLPVHAFLDERHLADAGLSNYWGYNPVAFSAIEPRYLSTGATDEFAETVERLHAAGIEVILDVVYNHSAESDQFGPTVSLRGLDNALYYRLDPANPRRYLDDAGCGNTLATERAPVLRMVMDSLRHWASLGVDGFRFDLATTLARSPAGYDPDGPFLMALRQDPALAVLKMIVEPWDIGPGGWQTGNFPEGFVEWNDHFRDDLRRFWRRDSDLVGKLATRMAGSPDLFQKGTRRPSASLNFITAHDGFTLRDLVSFGAKHNEANLEDNRDGTNDNNSWNNGVEGLTDDPTVTARRRADIRGLLACLLLARGTPMIAMGDELGRTQGGNNNAYCQDGPLSWVDWQQFAPEADGLAALIRRLVDLRIDHPALHIDRFLDPQSVTWRRQDGRPFDGGDWYRHDRRFIGMELRTNEPEPIEQTDPHPMDQDSSAYAVQVADDPDAVPEPVVRDSSAGSNRPDHVYVAINALDEPVRLTLPEPDHTWHQAVCSATDAPASILRTNEPELPARSVTVFTDRSVRVDTVDPAALRQLADLAGIDQGWWDIAGERHEVSPDSIKALLHAMRIDAATPGDVVEATDRLDRGPWRRMLSPLALARSDAAPTLELTVADPDRFIEMQLHAENGERRSVQVRPADGLQVASRRLDGVTRTRWRVTLPEILPQGRWQIRTNEPEPCTLIVSPGRCYLPPALQNGGRRFGLTTHLYALRRRDHDTGIGDFETLARFVDAGHAMGADIIGLNPFHALFPSDPERASPYYPSDRRFLDVRYLSQGAAQSTGRIIDYRAVVAAKLQAAEEGYAALSDQAGLARFIAEVGEPLAGFCLFQALEEKYGSSDWPRWPTDARLPETAGAEADPARVRFHAYIQWQLDRELAAAAERTDGMALGLYRDLAVGAAPFGSEFWSQQRRFARDVAVGSPPDPFSPTGQVWGVPPLDPHVLEGEGLLAWRNLLESNMRHAGALRIDHAMALQRLFWVPSGASALEGAYVRYPVDAMIAQLALSSQQAGCTVVAEDLGTVPEGFGERLADADILSTRVMWFERDGDRYRPPEEWPERAAACISTHDLPTLEGFWQADDIKLRARIDGVPVAEEAMTARAHERVNLAQAIGIDVRDEAELAPAAHAMLARTPCSLVVAQAEDLVGEVEQLNLPGTDQERPNWRRRLEVTVEDLADHPLARRVIAAMKAERPGG